MKVFLPRILALTLALTSTSTGVATETEPKATGQEAVVSSARPIAPNLDNLTPGPAETLKYAYWGNLDKWEKAQLSKDGGIAKTESSKDQHQEDDSDELVSPPAPKLPGLDWRQQAVRSGMSEATRSKLESHGLAIGGPFLKQSFEIYTENFLPSFVTSDSLLNTFHVLLEDTVKRIESKRAGRLRQVLEDSWQNLDSRLTKEKIERVTLEPYIRHLALVIGPALRLLGSDVKLGDREFEALVAAEVKKIEAAETVELPAWLAPAEPQLLAIDYRRCRPIGFYTESSRLVGYYRATRWLQMVPFRLSRDIELGAIGILGDLGKNGNDALDEYIEAGRKFWGETGDLDTSMNNSHPRFLSHCSYRNLAFALKEERTTFEVAATSRRTKLNDQVRLSSADSGSGDELNVRVLPPTELADAVMLDELMRQKQTAGDRRPWPNGLEVAYWLGSKWAAQVSAEWDVAKYLKPLDPMSERANFNGRFEYGVPGMYYSALSALFLPVDERAPGFMKSELWQRKSAQTALAGWAQLRHTWELQAKLNVMYASMRPMPAGFVEPNPEFFGRMSRLIGSIFDQMEASDLFTFEVGDELEFLEKALDAVRSKVLATRDEGLARTQDEDHNFASYYYDAAAYLSAHTARSAEEEDEDTKLFEEEFRVLQSENDPKKNDKIKEEFFLASERNEQKRVARLLEARIEGLRSGKLTPDPKSSESARKLRAHWLGLERLARQLEAMAHKQLAGEDWNEFESRLLRSYGETSAQIMGYGGNSWHRPKDDAPRWTTVFFDPARNTQLAVAIGRPQALYVLYPWKGQQVLCRGAVMSYYEYEADRRLTDKEWKAELDKPGPPRRPEWLQPLLPSER